MSVSAPFLRISLPTGVLPVKAIRSTWGCRTSISPTARSGPAITLTTPAGTRLAAMIFPSASAESGVSGDGLSTTVLPVTSAIASFQQAMRCGKFHGTIAAQTPSGSRRTTLRPGKNGFLPGSVSSHGKSCAA